MDYTTHVTLLARLSDGVDPSAWSEFHRRYGDLILGFARRYGLQSVDCEDVAQEVLMALSQSMADFQYDPAKGKFRSFLKTLTVRTIFRRIRQKQASEVQCDIEAADSGASSDDTIEALWEEEWQQYHIRQAMQRLEAEFNESDRMAFTQYAMENRPAEETAEGLGMSLGVCPRNRMGEWGRGLGMGQPSAPARGGSRNRNWQGRQRHVSPADHG